MNTMKFSDYVIMDPTSGVMNKLSIAHEGMGKWVKITTAENKIVYFDYISFYMHTIEHRSVVSVSLRDNQGKMTEGKIARMSTMSPYHNHSKEWHRKLLHQLPA